VFLETKKEKIMQVSKINSVAFQARTDKGNEYKKSNVGKIALVTSMAALDALPYVSKIKKLSNVSILQKASQKLSFLSMGEALKDFFPKVTGNKLKLMVAAGLLFDAVFAFTTGKIIDDAINKKRADKADVKAEAAQVLTETDDEE
jgi:hypothetical protein